MCTAQRLYAAHIKTHIATCGVPPPGWEGLVCTFGVCNADLVRLGGPSGCLELVEFEAIRARSVHCTILSSSVPELYICLLELVLIGLSAVEGGKAAHCSKIDSIFTFSRKKYA